MNLFRIVGIQWVGEDSVTIVIRKDKSILHPGEAWEKNRRADTPEELEMIFTEEIKLIGRKLTEIAAAKKREVGQ